MSDKPSEEYTWVYVSLFQGRASDRYETLLEAAARACANETGKGLCVYMGKSYSCRVIIEERQPIPPVEEIAGQQPTDEG